MDSRVETSAKGVYWESAVGLILLRCVDIALRAEGEGRKHELKEMSHYLKHKITAGEWRGPSKSPEANQRLSRGLDAVIRPETIVSTRSHFGAVLRGKALKLIPTTLSVISRIWSKPGIILADLYMNPIAQLKLSLHLRARIFIDSEPKEVESLERSRSELISNEVIATNASEVESAAWTLFVALVPNALLQTKLPVGAQKIFDGEQRASVITSIGLSESDTLKLLLAFRREKIHLTVLQHGASYGTLKWGQLTHFDISLPDLFVSWGRNPRSDCPPGFVTNGSPVRLKNRGDFKVGLVIPRQEKQWMFFDTLNLYEPCIRECDEFLEALGSDCLVTIRALPANFQVEQNWQDEARARYPEIKHSRDRTFLGFARKVNLVVFGYESTGMLQMLASDSPFVAFWPVDFDSLEGQFHPAYRALIDAQVIHSTGRSAAALVSQFSGQREMTRWWDSAEVKSARKLAQDYLARSEPRLEAALKKLVQESISRNRRIENHDLEY